MGIKYTTVVDVEVPTYGKAINLITATGPNIQICVTPDSVAAFASGKGAEARSMKCHIKTDEKDKWKRVLFSSLVLARRFGRVFEAIKSVPRDTWPGVYEVKSFEEKVAPSSWILGSSVDGKQFNSMQAELRQVMTEEAILVGTKLLVFTDSQSAGQFLIMHKRLIHWNPVGGFGGMKCPPSLVNVSGLVDKEFVAPKTVFTAKLERVEDYIWNCRDGRVMRLGEMADLHLLNCLEGRHGSEEMRERMVKVLRNRATGMRSAADGLDSRIDLALEKVKRNFAGFTAIPKERRKMGDDTDFDSGMPYG